MAEEDLVATIRADTSQFQSSMRELINSVQRVGQQTAEAMARATAEQQRAAAAARAAAKETKAFQDSLKQASQEAYKSSQTATQGLTGLTTSFKGVSQAAAAFGITLSLIGLKNFAESALAASVQMTSLQNSFKTITGSAAAAQAQLDFLRQESQRLGLSFVDTAEQMRGILAAARGTELEGEGVRQLFLATAEAGRVMGLSVERISRILVGFQQIVGKGVVQQEEWRQQISEALPQANQVMAKALGVTTQRLAEMIQQGQVGLAELSKFAIALRKDVAAGVAAASNTYQAATARMGTATNDLLVAFGDIVTKNPEVIKAINAIAKEIADTAKSIQDHQEDYKKGFKAIYDAIAFVFTIGKQWQETFAQMERDVQKWQKGVLNTMVETGKKIGLLLPTVQLPFMEITAPKGQEFLFRGAPGAEVPREEFGAVAAFDRQRQQLRTFLSDIDELRAKIREREGLLKLKDVIGMDPADAAQLENQLKKLRKQYEELTNPIDKAAQAIEKMATAGDLKNKIAQLQEYIRTQGLTGDALAVAMSKLEELQQKYDELTLGPLPESVKQFELLNRQLELTVTKFEATKAAMSPEQLRIATEEIANLNAEIAEANLTGLPESVKQYKLLEMELQRAEQTLAKFQDTLSPEQLVRENARLQEMREQLRQMGQAGLPEAVTEMRNLEAAIGAAMVQMVAFKASMTTDEMKAFNAVIDAMLERFAQLKDVSPAPAVNQLRQTERDIARVNAAIAASVDPAETRLLQKRLAELTNTVDTLGSTLNESLVKKGLMPAGQAMVAYGDQIAGGTENVKAFIEQQHELRMIMALTPDEATKEMARYRQELKDAGATAEEVQQVLFDQQRDEMQRVRDTIDQVSETTSDFLFDFATALTDSSKDVKDVWQDTLKSLQAMFLRTLTDMAAKALVANIKIPVSLGGTGTSATGSTGGIDLSGLLKWLQGGGGAGTPTPSTPTPPAAPSPQAMDWTGVPPDVQAQWNPVSTGAGGATAVGTGATAIGGGSTAVSGLSTTGAASAVGSGLAAGTFTSGLFQQAGWSGTGANVAAGAVGGAVTGAMIGSVVPVLGTAVGALAGAALGALIPALSDPRTRQLVAGALPGLRHMQGFQEIQQGQVLQGLIRMGGAGIPANFMNFLGFLDKASDTFYAAMRTADKLQGQGFFQGAGRRGPFGFVGVPGALDVPPGSTGADFADLFVTIDEAIATHLTQRQKELATAVLQAQGQGPTIHFKTFDNEIFDLARDRMSTILEGLAREEGFRGGEVGRLAEQVFAGIRRDDKNLQQLEEAFAQATSFFETLHSLTTEPLSEAEKALAALNEQFDLLAMQAEQYGVSVRIIEEARKREVTQFFTDIVKNLKIQQENLLRSITSTRQFVEESTMTPAVIFQRRQEELQSLQTEFLAASQARQVAMAPELLQRIQQLMQASMSTDVLGQDREQVLKLRQDLLSFIDTIEEMAGQEAFDKQIAKAQQQIDAIDALKTITDDQLTQANATLARIERFLTTATTPIVGSFQQGGTIPETGLAFVHKGESVLPPGQSPINMSITVNVPGGEMSRRQATEAANVIWQVLEDRARRREIPLKLEHR